VYFLFAYRKIFILFLLLVFSAFSVKAQESIYNELLKESMKTVVKEIPIALELDTGFHKGQQINDFNEESLRRMIARGRIELLLPNENPSKFDNNINRLSPIIITYDNSKYNNEINLDNGKFNGNGTFSGEFATKADILMSKGVYFMLPMSGIASKAIKSKKKESKKEKRLRIIKEVYNIKD